MSQIKKIAPHEAKNIYGNQDTVLIDVREPAEYRAEHIIQAKNIPLSKINIDLLKQQIAGVNNLVLHCKSGRRAQEAAKKIKDIEYAQIFIVDGSFEELKSSGFQTKESSKSILPLDRQVQLVVSLMVLTGLIINHTVSPWGLLLPLFAGLGLLNASITGWCGMAKLLAKMPWNQ
tara:strand:+ start:330 stop:854 length:525 start_codon:yes stop_codon:yes gene_type:complete